MYNRSNQKQDHVGTHVYNDDQNAAYALSPHTGMFLTHPFFGESKDVYTSCPTLQFQYDYYHAYQTVTGPFWTSPMLRHS